MPKAPKLPPRPLSKPEVCDPPKQKSGPSKRDAKTIWTPAIETVRRANGRTVKICVHPKARNLLGTLKKLFPDCDFMSRAVPVDRGTSYGVWAWVKTAAVERPPEPPPPGVPPPNPEIAPPL